MENTAVITQNTEDIILNTEIDADALMEETTLHLNSLVKHYSKAVIDLMYAGYELKWFKDSKRYKFLGFSTFEEFAMEQFNIVRASAYNYINVFEHCTTCIEQCNQEPIIEMKDEYKDYTFSQLLAILTVKDEEEKEILQVIKPSMSVREINRVIKDSSKTSADSKDESNGITVSFDAADNVDTKCKEVMENKVVCIQDRHSIAVDGNSWNDIISTKTQKAVSKVLESEESTDDLVIEIVISHRN